MLTVLAAFAGWLAGGWAAPLALDLSPIPAVYEFGSGPERSPPTPAADTIRYERPQSGRDPPADPPTGVHDSGAYRAPFWASPFAGTGAPVSPFDGGKVLIVPGASIGLGPHELRLSVKTPSSRRERAAEEPDALWVPSYRVPLPRAGIAGLATLVALLVVRSRRLKLDPM